MSLPTFTFNGARYHAPRDWQEQFATHKGCFLDGARPRTNIYRDGTHFRQHSHLWMDADGTVSIDGHILGQVELI
jgi:hypothetical protein